MLLQENSSFCRFIDRQPSIDDREGANCQSGERSASGKRYAVSILARGIGVSNGSPRYAQSETGWAKLSKIPEWCSLTRVCDVRDEAVAVLLLSFFIYSYLRNKVRVALLDFSPSTIQPIATRSRWIGKKKTL